MRGVSGMEFVPAGATRNILLGCGDACVLSALADVMVLQTGVRVAPAVRLSF